MESINENYNDIEVTVNGIIYTFTFDEAQALFCGLSDFFINYDNEQGYEWEVQNGIPPVYDIIENNIDEDGSMYFITKYEDYEIY